jgi:hypothetical protein
MKKITKEQILQNDIKNTAKALVSLYIDAGSDGINEAVRLARIPAGILAPQLLTALEKMVDIFGVNNPPEVGLTVGDRTCDEAREAIKQAKAERN